MTDEFIATWMFLKLSSCHNAFYQARFHNCSLVIMCHLGCWLISFFLLGKQVQDSSDVIKDGRVRVVFNVPHEPQLETLIQNQHVRCTHTHTPVKAFNRVDSEDTCHAYTICASHTYCLASMCLYFVEVLCEVQSWIRSGISSGSHQLPRLPLLRKHLYWKRLQEKVSVQPPYNIHLDVTVLWVDQPALWLSLSQAYFKNINSPWLFRHQCFLLHYLQSLWGAES